jgi:hypothetical protein
MVVPTRSEQGRSGRCNAALYTSVGSMSALAYVTDGREAIGHIIARGKLGYEAFDRSEASLGLFKTQAAAANAVFGAAKSEENAG